MNNDLKQLQTTLLDQLAASVAPLGYTARSGQSFYRTAPFGRTAFHVSFIEHAADFDITADVAVRFDRLELLITPANKATSSLGAELGNIKEGKPKRWTLSTGQEVPLVAAAIVEEFESVGLPYLEKYSNEKNALEILSGDDAASWMHCPLHGERAKRALGLAHLLQDRAAFDRLLLSKTEFLEKRKDFGLPAFKIFAQSLKPR